ncbi:MAG: DHH family phosphoesterase [Bacilli bacterium]|jgi:single-stranded-DNA-specific exonuclease
MEFLDELLNYYQMTREQYAQMTRPLNFDEMRFDQRIKSIAPIVERIKKAIRSHERIIVYGDYDCDGIMSVSIIVKVFEMLDYPINYYVPSRYIDGYGLNVQRVREIAEKGYSLIITVDNGISAFEAIDLAKEKGIDTIVVDHHEVQEKLPNALGILHPFVSEFGKIAASGGMMSFILATALLDRVDSYLLSLAGISTVSDMMPLLEYNRDLLRLALQEMNKHAFPAFKKLTNGKWIDEKVISMEIAPKINAVGRMDETTNINRLIKYFTSSTVQEIEAYGGIIESVNDTRKALTKDIVASLGDIHEAPGLVLNLPIKEGLIGLIANRLVNEYQVPTIVFTEDSVDETLLKGSMRSKEGFNITKAFKSLDKYLVTFGGHAFAGGLAIRKSDFISFKKDFIDLADKYRFVEEEMAAIEISLAEVNMSNYEILKTFSPFGEGFREPNFVVRGLSPANLSFISEGKHLSTSIGMNAKILGFNMPENEVRKHNRIKIYGNLRSSEYRGRYTLEFRVSSYRSDNLL